jgi:hypothetical protein
MGHENSIIASRWPAWLNAAALLVATWIAIVGLSFQISLSAEIVSKTSIPAVLVVRPDDRAGLARLREAGAWLAMDPRAIAGCLTL